MCAVDGAFGRVEAMAIQCAYCNGEHASPAEVRQCWHDGGRREVPTSGSDALPFDDGAYVDAPIESPLGSERASTTPQRPSRAVAVVTRTVPRGVASAGAGPDELGRHVVVEPGGSIPERWADAQRIVIDAGTLTDPAHALAFLRAAHHARERLVIELAASFEREPMLMTEAAPYELGPTFAFDLEELHHLVWSNSVDRRDPARPTWIALDMAIAAGAAPADGRGDVRLPDGTVAWLDGGPVRHTDPIDGVPVSTPLRVEHGSLAPAAARIDSAADLAPDQLAAVTHRGGGARIIAPAGSGKTRVLTERARHLLTTGTCRPAR